MIVPANASTIAQAAELIKKGDVVGMPTETVYGLACDALNAEAVKKVFDIKRRSTKDPLIVHVCSIEQLESVAEIENRKMFETLALAFWPGPLTLVLKKKSIIPDLVTAGRSTVAVRIPRHAVALDLIKLTGPLAAPSANRFQKLSPTTAQAVQEELENKVPLILDAGPCDVGVESTILLLAGGVKLLRPGGITLESLEATLNRKVERVQVSVKDDEVEAPGMMSFHYSPTKPLHVFKPHALRVHVDLEPKEIKSWGLLCFSDKDAASFKDAGFKIVEVLSPRGDLIEASQRFFATIRKLDNSKVLKIAALLCPDKGLGKALNDRLQKAQHG